MTPPTSRWRTVFRLSLRTFFVLLTLACLAGGWFVNRVLQQRESVKWVRAHGGVVEYDLTLLKENISEGPLFPPEPDRYSSATPLGRVADLVGVDYVATPEYVELAGLENGDIAPLGNLGWVRRLHLWSCNVHDLRPLSNMPHLYELWLRGNPCEDLRPLANLRELRKLHIASTPVRDISPLAEIPTLRQLDLSHTKNLTDLSPLARMTTLNELVLIETPAQDFRPLHRMRGLKLLKISGPHLTLQAIEDLRAALPNCNIGLPPLNL